MGKGVTGEKEKRVVIETDTSASASVLGGVNLNRFIDEYSLCKGSFIQAKTSSLSKNSQ